MASVTNRYARALVDVIFERKLNADQVRRELQLIAGTVAESEPLRRVWESPVLPADQKRSLLDALAQRLGISRPVRNFIAVLIDHERIALLPEIVHQVELELDRRLGLAEAEITTARDLREDEKRVLESQIERLTGKKVRARYQRDPDLLGGAVIKLGSTIYDGSVSGQLERL